MKKTIPIFFFLIAPLLCFAQFKEDLKGKYSHLEKAPVRLISTDITDDDHREQFSPKSIESFTIQKSIEGKLKTIHFDGGRPIWISGQLEDLPKYYGNFEAQVTDYLENASKILNIQNPREEFIVESAQEDKNNGLHVRVKQIYNDIPVYGSEMILHASNGIITHLNGRMFATPENISIQPTIDAAKADELAWQMLNKKSQNVDNPDAFAFLKIERFKKELVIYHEAQNPSKELLCWHVSAYPNIAEHWELFIDAHTGELIHSFINTCNLLSHHHEAELHKILPPDGDATATATDLNNQDRLIHTWEQSGTYYLIDGSRSMFNAGFSNMPNEPVGVIWTIDAFNSSPQQFNFTYDHFKSANNTWSSSPEGVSAHFNGGESYNYFKQVHNRESISGDGGNIISFVNVADEDGQGMDNAFWNGVAIFYGNGRTAFEPLAKALDVACHELTHGVIQSTANLEYYGESGAINESFADIFAAMIDRDDWTIGEDVVNSNVFTSGALRSLSNPNNGQAKFDFGRGWQPDHVDDQFTGPEDNNGVHINSGIPNHAFYLFATQIGKEKAEDVFYHALTNYLTRSSQFIDLRLAVIQSAQDLYVSNEVDAAKTAFDQVGILDGNATDTQEDVELNEGSDFIVYADQNLDKLVLMDGDKNILADPFSNTDPISKPSVTDDGSRIVFIGSDKQMHQITIDWDADPVTYNEVIIQSQPIWRNVVISKDGNRVAALLEGESDSISVFDFTIGAWKDFELYNPTFSEGVSTGEVLYADAMEFDITGEWLMYDAKNDLRSNTGIEIEYWDVGFLNVWNNTDEFWEDGLVQKLFAALPEGVSIGNPTFSKNSPFIVAFDFLEGQDYKILGANIETGMVSEIFPNTSLGYPNYSRNDQQLLFDNEFIFATDLGILDLKESKIERIEETETIFVAEARWGTWFSNGQRNLNTSTENIVFATPEILLKPNPANDILEITLVERFIGNIMVRLMDLKGAVINKRLLTSVIPNQVISIDVSNLQNGTYILQIQSEEQTINRKIVKL